jgi:hypothetical protein
MRGGYLDPGGIPLRVPERALRQAKKAKFRNNFWGMNLPDQEQSKRDIQAFLSLLADSSKAAPTGKLLNR